MQSAKNISFEWFHITISLPIKLTFEGFQIMISLPIKLSFDWSHVMVSLQIKLSFDGFHAMISLPIKLSFDGFHAMISLPIRLSFECSHVMISLSIKSSNALFIIHYLFGNSAQKLSKDMTFHLYHSFSVKHLNAMLSTCNVVPNFDFCPFEILPISPSTSFFESLLLIKHHFWQFF